MTLEIERKFHVEDVPPAEVLGSGQRLRQGYLAREDDVEVRIRLGDGTATLTVKAGRGVSRTEVELALSAEQVEALWPCTAGRRLEKTRHRLRLDLAGHPIADVDLYAGVLHGLCTVEVEFDSAGSAAAFTPPGWFGRELTGEPGWSNGALARHGVPHGDSQRRAEGGSTDDRDQK